MERGVKGFVVERVEDGVTIFGYCLLGDELIVGYQLLFSEGVGGSREFLCAEGVAFLTYGKQLLSVVVASFDAPTLS